MIEEELGYVKSELKRAIGLLPENALVGFLSFGTQVQVHELGFSEISKVYVFRGSKEISKDQVLEQLGLGGAGRRAVGGYPKGVQNGFASSGVTRFLLPASDCEYTLNSVRHFEFLFIVLFFFYFVSWRIGVLVLGILFYFSVIG